MEQGVGKQEFLSPLVKTFATGEENIWRYREESRPDGWSGCQTCFPGGEAGGMKGVMEKSSSGYMIQEIAEKIMGSDIDQEETYGPENGYFDREAGGSAQPATITNTMEAVEEMLGGAVQIGCFMPQRVLLISRQDAAGLALNRPMPDGKGHISGTFLLCGVPEEGCRFASLTPAQRREFQRIFAAPGEFMAVGGVVYTDPDDVADAAYRLWETLGDGDTVVLTKWGSHGKNSLLQERSGNAG